MKSRLAPALALAATGSLHCWDEHCEDTFCPSHEVCCHPIFGSRGLHHCWDDQYFTYEICCWFWPKGGNDRFLPMEHMETLRFVTHFAQRAHPGFPGYRVLELRQNTSGTWDARIPGMLFKQAPAMLRWFETLPDEVFKGKRVLEFGTGLGMLSIHAAYRGGDVTATDGDERARELSLRNAEWNLPSENLEHFRAQILRWQDAERGWQALGLEAPYDVIICSALLYASTELVKSLVRLMWTVSESHTDVLWGSGQVRDPLRQERWVFVMLCFDVLEDIDAVDAKFSLEEGTRVMRLRPRGRHDPSLWPLCAL